MAAQSNEKGKGVSFTFLKTKPASKLVKGNKKYKDDIDETESDKDFLHSAEGKVLKRCVS